MDDGRWPERRRLADGRTDDPAGSCTSPATGRRLWPRSIASAGRLADAEAEARTAWDILRDLEPVSLPVLTAVSSLLVTLIARGHLDEAQELAEQWDLSAPFSVIPLAPPLLHIRGTLRLARGELETGAEDLVAIGEDLEAMHMLNPAAIPWRQHVVPALGALDRTAEARRIARRGRATGTRVRRRTRDRHDAARQVLDRDQAAPRSRPCESRSPRSSRAARHMSSPTRVWSWGPRCVATASAATHASRCAGRSSSPTPAAPTGSPAGLVRSWPRRVRGPEASFVPALTP